MDEEELVKAGASTLHVEAVSLMYSLKGGVTADQILSWPVSFRKKIMAASEYFFRKIREESERAKK